MGKTLILGVLSALLGAGAITTLQGKIDAWRGELNPAEEILYVPKGLYLKPAVLGYDVLVADLLWARAVLLFGEKYKQTEDPTWYQFFYRMADVASDLDPLNPNIYLNAGLLLRDAPDMHEEANAILEKGIDHVDHFFIPLTRGMNALEFDRDHEAAARYMSIAAQRPKAPAYLPRLVASLMSKGGEFQVAQTFLIEQLKTTKPGSLHYVSIQSKLREVQYQGFQWQLMESRTRFQNIFGRDPESPSEMLGVSMRAKTLPPDPYGGEWVFSPEDGRIISSAREAALYDLMKKYGIGLPKHVFEAQTPPKAAEATPEGDAPPTDGAPTDGAPTDGAPTDGAPTDGAPTDGAPTDGAQGVAPADAPAPGDAPPEGAAPPDPGGP